MLWFLWKTRSLCNNAKLKEDGKLCFNINGFCIEYTTPCNKDPQNFWISENYLQQKCILTTPVFQWSPRNVTCSDFNNDGDNCPKAILSIKGKKCIYNTDNSECI